MVEQVSHEQVRAEETALSSNPGLSQFPNRSLSPVAMEAAFGAAAITRDGDLVHINVRGYEDTAKAEVFLAELAEQTGITPKHKDYLGLKHVPDQPEPEKSSVHFTLDLADMNDKAKAGRMMETVLLSTVIEFLESKTAERGVS